MEDDNIQAVEQEESDSFMEGWDDEGGSAEADGAPEVVQEPAGAGPDEPQEGGGEEPEGEGREQEEPAQEAPSAAPQEQPRTWTLTHQGQALTGGLGSLGQKIRFYQGQKLPDALFSPGAQQLFYALFADG